MLKQVRKGPGSGIGLAIVQRIIDRHGGTVELDSDGKTWTTVRFTLQSATPDKSRRGARRHATRESMQLY